MEVIQEAPAVELPPSVATEQATPAPDATAAPGEASPDEGKKPEATPKTFTQEELDDIVQKRVAKESRRAERIALERARREAAEAEVVRLRAERDGDPKGKAPQGEPEPSDFKTPQDYVRALVRWERQQADAQSNTEANTNSEKRAAAEHARSMIEAVFKGSEKFPDFREVALAEELDISAPMAYAIAESDCPADVLYHLGQNTDEAVRIGKLKPTRQVVEIDGIAKKLLATATAAAKTKTPAPIVPGGTQGVVQKDTKDMTDAEWDKWREADLKAKRSR